MRRIDSTSESLVCSKINTLFISQIDSFSHIISKLYLIKVHSFSGKQNTQNVSKLYLVFLVYIYK